MFMFTFSMTINRTIEHIQMTAVATCDGHWLAKVMPDLTLTLICSPTT